MNVGFIGAGKMAEAMMSALVASGVVRGEALTACDPSEERRCALRQRLGIRMHAEADAVIECSDVLFLAVKPQQLEEALTAGAPRIGQQHLVISIAAGKTIAFLESLLPEARTVRVMPNLPCVVNASVSAYCLGSRATGQDRVLVAQLLAIFGEVRELPESQFDAVTALSGSGPAFFAYLLSCMVDGAVALGLDRNDALQLAQYTMLGTAKLLVEKEMDPLELISSVSSAKGTTVEGLSVLTPSDVGAVLSETLKAAARRSRELSA